MEYRTLVDIVCEVLFGLYQIFSLFTVYMASCNYTTNNVNYSN